MKKVSAYCVFNRYTKQVYSLFFRYHNGTNINFTDCLSQNYNTVKDIVDNILAIAKSNNCAINFSEYYRARYQ